MSDDKLTSIESVMTPIPLETRSPDSTILDIANKMREKSKAAIIIVEDTRTATGRCTTTGSSILSRPIGIITERDMVRRIVSQEKDPRNTQASEVMSKPLISVGPEASIYDASSIMAKHNIRRLPITRDNVRLGIITATDLSRYIYDKNKADHMLKAMSRYKQAEGLSQ
ncbi:MAG: CBS domain-containing protein [Nitrososphaeraceae archaeon]